MMIMIMNVRIKIMKMIIYRLIKKNTVYIKPKDI